MPVSMRKPVKSVKSATKAKSAPAKTSTKAKSAPAKAMSLKEKAKASLKKAADGLKQRKKLIAALLAASSIAGIAGYVGNKEYKKYQAKNEAAEQDNKSNPYTMFY
jgi:hypothetical protein